MLPRPNRHVLTLALSDGRDLPSRGRVAVDATILQNALGLSEVLKGAVDSDREIRHVPGLQYKLWQPKQEVWVSRVSSPHPVPHPYWVATLTGTWDTVTETLRGCTVSCTHCSRSEAKR